MARSGTSMRPLLILAASACMGRPPTATPASVVDGEPPPPSGKRTHLEVKATERGIMGSYGPMTHTLITAEAARLLRTDGQCLYFFAPSTPALNVLRLDSDSRARRILELEPIDHPRFPASDPLAYLQRQEDLSVEPGFLCLDIHDRADQPTVTYNIRVDLIHGTQARHLVADLHGASPGAEPVRPRLCTPHGPSAERSADGTYLSLEL